LTYEEASELTTRMVRAYKANPKPELLARILKINTGFVRSVVLKVRNTVPTVLSLEDLEQVGMMGLISSIGRYQANGKTAFRSYAYSRILGAAQDAVRAASSTSKTRNVTFTSIDNAPTRVLVSSLDGEIASTVPDEVSQALFDAIEELPLRQCMVVLLSVNGLTAQKIADVFGISTSRINQEKSAAITTLREELLKTMQNGSQNGRH
jgi:RNA polymerase sigma factor (sigma-70 family)